MACQPRSLSLKSRSEEKVTSTSRWCPTPTRYLHKATWFWEKVPDLRHVQVSAKGWFIAMISTTVETDNPEAEIQPGLNLLGPITQKFIQVTLAIWPWLNDEQRKVQVGVSLKVTDSFEPTEDGTSSQLFISKTYDATSHFETTCVDVLDIFKRGTGEEFDFSKVKHTLEDQE